MQREEQADGDVASGGDVVKSTLLLTTGEVARLCRVSESTASRWCDEGLRHHRLPKTGAGRMKPRRRIKAAHLRRFLREKGLPIPSELELNCGEGNAETGVGPRAVVREQPASGAEGGGVADGL